MIRELFLQDLSLWSCVWQSTLSAVIGLVGSLLLQRRPARAFQVLFLTMIAAVVVPAMSVFVKHFELGVFVVKPITPQPISMDLYSAVPFEARAPVAEPQANAKKHLEAALAEGGTAGIDIPWRAILLLGWVTATLALLGRLLIAFMNGVRMIWRSQPEVREHIQQALDRARSRLGIMKNLQIRASGEIHSPMIWCWSRKAVLLVPVDLNNKVDWVGITCHELAHYKRRDHICGLIAELTVCVLCWNPLSWLAKKRLIRLGEQACDDWVVAGGQSVENYARSLLNFKPQKQAAFVPAVVHSRKGVAARVRRILKDSCVNPRTGVKWALGVSLVTACLAAGMAFAQTRPAKPATAIVEGQDTTTESLYKAAAEGDIEKVKSLISAGANVNERDKNGQTALHLAVINGYKDVVELLIAKGAEIDGKGRYNATPLHEAAWAGNKEISQILLDKGANANALQGESRWTPLLSACSRGHAEVAELLIQKGAEVNARDKWGDTPLYYAVWNEDFKTTRVLVVNGADLNYIPEGEWPPLYYMLWSNEKDLVELMVEKGSRAPAFHLAAFRGDLAKVKSFYANGMDVDARDELNWTPLHWAASGGQMEVAEFLIDKGADIKAETKYDSTPLNLAATKELVELLLSKGASINTTSEGSTPLHCAAKRGSVKVAEVFISHGLYIEAKDKSGRTPLYVASIKSKKEMVEFLIAKGADVNTRDNQGRSALSLAVTRGHTEVAELLRKHGARESLHDVVAAGDVDKVKQLISQGADINAKDGRRGQAALHLAVLTGRKDIVELLIASGADINAKSNTWDTTPLVAAVRAGQEDIAKVLIAKGADVNARALGDYTALHWAACNRAQMTGVTEIMGLLLAGGADIEARQEHGATPLACATYDGNTETTRFLIEHSANIEAKLNDGETTPLLRAVSQEYVETAKLLLDKGANIHATWRGLSAIQVAMLGDRLSNRRSDKEMVELLIDRGQKSPPIHLAAFYGDLQRLKDCLNDGTRVDERDAAEWTPLHCAVCGDHMDVVKFLLNKGANVNAKTKNNWTPLGFAWTIEMARLLVANGADPRIVDDYGQTVLHWTVNRNNHRGDKTMIELLLEHGTNINAKAGRIDVGWAGWTPLHVACRNGALDIVELLLAHGADINAKTDKGETPIAIAQNNKQSRIVEILRRHGAQE
jgi:ankyrin repeat protein